MGKPSSFKNEAGFRLGSENPVGSFGDVKVYLTWDSMEFACTLTGDYEGADERDGRLRLTAASLVELEEKLRKVAKRRPPLDLAVVEVDSPETRRWNDEDLDPADAVGEPVVLLGLEARGRSGCRLAPREDPTAIRTSSPTWLVPAGSAALPRLVELVGELNAARRKVLELDEEFDRVADEAGVRTGDYSRQDLASVAQAEADLAAALKAKGAAATPLERAKKAKGRKARTS